MLVRLPVERLARDGAVGDILAAGAVMCGVGVGACRARWWREGGKESVMEGAIDLLQRPLAAERIFWIDEFSEHFFVANHADVPKSMRLLLVAARALLE